LYPNQLDLAIAIFHYNKKIKLNKNLGPLFQDMSLRVSIECIHGEWKKKRVEQEHEVKLEPKTEACDKPIEKTIEKKQSKMDKGKKVAYYHNRPKTRETNKLRLNSKYFFKPSLKKDNLIILDEDAMETVPKKIKRERKQPPVPYIELSNSEVEIEQDPTYTLEINKVPGSYVKEIQTIENFVEKEIIVG
jgi:hypothetical protein